MEWALEAMSAESDEYRNASVHIEVVRCTIQNSSWPSLVCKIGSAMRKLQVMIEWLENVTAHSGPASSSEGPGLNWVMAILVA